VVTLNKLAEIEREMGNLGDAMRLYLESHILALDTGSQLYAAIAMENLAALTRLQGDLQNAYVRFREALLLYRSVGDLEGIVSCVSGLALAAAAQGQHWEASALLGVLAAVCSQHDQPAPAELADAAQSLRQVMGEAAFDKAWTEGNVLPLDDAIARIVKHGSRLHPFSTP
jgi:hypothetical protein